MDAIRPKGSAIGVRDLAAFVHRRGDIHHRYEKATLAEEGIARQKEWQKSRGEGYRREFFVSDNGMASKSQAGWMAGTPLPEWWKRSRPPASMRARCTNT